MIARDQEVQIRRCRLRIELAVQRDPRVGLVAGAIAQLVNLNMGFGFVAASITHLGRDQIHPVFMTLYDLDRVFTWQRTVTEEASNGFFSRASEPQKKLYISLKTASSPVRKAFLEGLLDR